MLSQLLHFMSREVPALKKKTFENGELEAAKYFGK